MVEGSGGNDAQGVEESGVQEIGWSDEGSIYGTDRWVSYEENA